MHRAGNNVHVGIPSGVNGSCLFKIEDVWITVIFTGCGRDFERRCTLHSGERYLTTRMIDEYDDEHEYMRNSIQRLALTSLRSQADA